MATFKVIKVDCNRRKIIHIHKVALTNVFFNLHLIRMKNYFFILNLIFIIFIIFYLRVIIIFILNKKFISDLI